MSCLKIMDLYYEDDGHMPLLNQLRIWAHTFFCHDCAAKIHQYENAKAILKEDFFPYSPEQEDRIMARIAAEKEQTEADTAYAAPGGISTRAWVISGLIIFISLTTAFFGLDFKNLASVSGMSFMLPMGITIGIVLTTYCALFIGSHLKELSERFGL
jgi:hypothetical protein